MFWEKFLFLCNEKNVSPSAAVTDLGISIGSITKWKRGAMPRDSTIRRIAHYFNVTVEYLYGDTDNPHQAGLKTVVNLFRGADPSDSLEERTYITPSVKSREDSLKEEKAPSAEAEEDELTELLQELKTRPEMKMLFSLAKGATKEDVELAVQIIERMRRQGGDGE